jgi:hypothetical protein
LIVIHVHAFSTGAGFDQRACSFLSKTKHVFAITLGAAGMPDHARSVDRNLLFGIIALQMDFITRDQLIAAMNEWILDNHKPLGQVLSEQGALATEDHEAIRGESLKDNRERLQLALRAYEKKLYMTSARLYGEALAADPKLADDREEQIRFNAACTAALAAVSNPGGMPSVWQDPPRSEADRARLRHQARKV